MRQLAYTIMAGILALGVSAQDAPPATPELDIRAANSVTMDEFLWQNRLIIVFADSERDPVFRTQLELLAERAQDLIDRDVIVITDTDPLNPSDIREELHPRGFGMVLVDKDGGIKLRKPAPWDVREIASSIDKTALRKEELREARRKSDGGS